VKVEIACVVHSHSVIGDVYGVKYGTFFTCSDGMSRSSESMEYYSYPVGTTIYIMRVPKEENGRYIH